MRRMGAWLLAALALFWAGAAHADKRIALTFDDAPRDRGAFMSPAERSERIVAALRDGAVRQAAFFVNPGYLERPDGQGGEARLAAYVRAGHVLANHSWNHVPLSATTAEAYLADIDRAEAWLKGRPGYRAWYRFPQLDEGRADKAKRDAVRAGLAARGLLNAQVTADGSDWFLEMLSLDAQRAGKTMNRAALGRLYVAAHMSGAEHAAVQARRLLGRSPAHVLLMHETDLAALFLPDLIAELKRNGWTIITADQAFRDPLYRLAPDAAEARGSILDTLAAERRVVPPAWPVWLDPLLIKALFDRQVLGQRAGAAGIP